AIANGTKNANIISVFRSSTPINLYPKMTSNNDMITTNTVVDVARVNRLYRFNVLYIALVLLLKHLI
ncbi:MAG: hypothetical protein WBM35_14240, partial [Candidatus Electrothrix sp.]